MSVTVRTRHTRVILKSVALPASMGDSPVSVTPMDITPADASWADLQVREKVMVGVQEREEGELDEALEMTFPASDPTAELPVAIKTGETDAQELLLDMAIEMSFPASDPVAIASPHPVRK